MSSTRRASDKDCERKPLPKEFEFPEDMVGKVIGKEGKTVQGIEDRSGARCFVHPPDEKDPRAYMATTGSDEQIDKAFEELKKEVAKKNPRFADDMQATITMQLSDEDARALMDQGERELQKIERKFGTSIRTQCQKDGESCVRIVGPIGVVELPRGPIQQLVDSLERLSLTTESHRYRRERESKKEVRFADDRTRTNEKKNHRADPPKSPRVHYRDASQPVDTEEFLRDWTAEVRINARTQAFKCLIGENGDNIKKIKSECDAKIKVQDKRDVIDDFQHVDISGLFDDVMIAIPKVTESLRWYDPKRDDARPRDRRQDLNRNSEDSNEIRAKASVKIFDDAMGLIIGRGGSNKKRIEDKTNASVRVDDEEDDEGLRTVKISGESMAVMEALDEVKKSVKKYKPQDPKAETRSPRSMSPSTRQRHSTIRRSRERD